MIINPYALAAASVGVQLDAASQLGTWTLSESNLRALNTGSNGVEAGIRLDTPIAASGNTYLEMYVYDSGSITLGLGVTSDGTSPIPAAWYNAASGYMYYGGDGNFYHNGATAWSGIGVFSNTNTIGLCIKNGKLYWHRDGDYGAGNPDAETGAAFSGLSGNYYPAIFAYNNGVDMRLRLSAADMAYTIPTGASTMVP